jgi:hypothetical protein
VQGSSSEGLANHTGPRVMPSAPARVSAKRWVRIGWVLSRENTTPGTIEDLGPSDFVRWTRGL